MPQYNLRPVRPGGSGGWLQGFCLSRRSGSLLLLEQRKHSKSFASSSITCVHWPQGYIFSFALHLIWIFLLLPIFLALAFCLLLPFSSHITGLFPFLPDLLLFLINSFHLPLNRAKPLNPSALWCWALLLCSCHHFSSALATFISEWLNSIFFPACNGLCPCSEAFLSTLSCAKQTTTERRRERLGPGGQVWAALAERAIYFCCFSMAWQGDHSLMHNW